MLYPPEGCVIRKLCLQPWAAGMLVFRPVGAVRWKSLLILKALWRKFALGHLCSLFQHTAKLWVHKIYFNFGWSQTCNKKPSRVRGGNEAMGRRNRHEAAVCSICSVRLQRRGFGERPIECTFTPKPERHQVCYWFQTCQEVTSVTRDFPFDHLNNTCFIYWAHKYQHVLLHTEYIVCTLK